MRDLTNESYGDWVVKGFSHRERAKSATNRKSPCYVYFWLCECTAPTAGGICGVMRPVRSTNLRKDGGSTNCGCQRVDHGMSNHPAWQSWHAMRQRCNNPNEANYPLYGGRGIRVCEQWNDFKKFWEDMGPTWAEGRSLDRYPNQDGNYEPENCRWATPREQAHNRRSNRIIQTPLGLLNVTEAADKFGLDRNTIYTRILNGWADEDLLLPVSESRDGEGRFDLHEGRAA